MRRRRQQLGCDKNLSFHTAENQALSQLPRQVKNLDCIDPLREAFCQDTGISEPVRTMLLSSLPQLTHERRNEWLGTLNPLVVNDDQLSKIRSICPVTGIATKIAIVLITNGISLNIQEWITYHLFIGVSRIIIYEMSNPDSIQRSNFLAAVRPFVVKGFVIIHHEDVNVEFNENQRRCYNNALKSYRYEYDWMGFIDGDEFVIMHQTKCLTAFLNEYGEFGAVELQWKLFIGVSIHDSSKPIFEQYKYASSNPNVKIFVQPKYVSKMYVHHADFMNDSMFAVNVYKRRNHDHNVNNEKEAEPFAVAELRHYNMGDMQFALYEKACGLNQEREKYRAIRRAMLVQMFQRKSIYNLETPLALPLIYGEFSQYMYKKNDNNQSNWNIKHLEFHVVFVNLLLMLLLAGLLASKIRTSRKGMYRWKNTVSKYNAL